jgi:hypothetical protein
MTDEELTALVRDAADSVRPGLPLRVAPAANDDPYRWGSHGWAVSVGVDPRVDIWIPAQAGPDWIFKHVVDALRADPTP